MRSLLLLPPRSSSPHPIQIRIAGAVEKGRGGFDPLHVHSSIGGVIRDVGTAPSQHRGTMHTDYNREDLSRLCKSPLIEGPDLLYAEGGLPHYSGRGRFRGSSTRRALFWNTSFCLSLIQIQDPPRKNVGDTRGPTLRTPIGPALQDI